MLVVYQSQYTLTLVVIVVLRLLGHARAEYS